MPLSGHVRLQEAGDEKVTTDSEFRGIIRTDKLRLAMEVLEALGATHIMTSELEKHEARFIKNLMKVKR